MGGLNLITDDCLWMHRFLSRLVEQVATESLSTSLILHVKPLSKPADLPVIQSTAKTAPLPSKKRNNVHKNINRLILKLLDTPSARREHVPAHVRSWCQCPGSRSLPLPGVCIWRWPTGSLITVSLWGHEFLTGAGDKTQQGFTFGVLVKQWFPFIEITAFC